MPIDPEVERLMRVQFERYAEEWENAMPAEEALAIMERHIAERQGRRGNGPSRGPVIIVVDRIEEVPLMSTSDSQRFDRLPKWAQTRINTLEANLVGVQAKLSAGPTDSDTFADPYSSAPRPLGTGTRIEFRFYAGPGGSLIAHLIDGRLRIQGGDRITILPSHSNTIDIEMGR